MSERIVLSNLVHGAEPGYRLVGGDYVLEPGEVFYDRYPQPGEVWDATTGALRFPTPAEVLATAKAAKLSELARAYAGANKAQFSQVDPEDAIWLCFTLYASGASTDARIVACRANRDRFANLQAQVQRITDPLHVEEVRALSWASPLVAGLAPLFSVAPEEDDVALESAMRGGKGQPWQRPLALLRERLDGLGRLVAGKVDRL